MHKEILSWLIGMNNTIFESKSGDKFVDSNILDVYSQKFH